MGSSCDEQEAGGELRAMERDMTTAQVALPIGGMTCPSCAESIERALAKVDGVEQARVNWAWGNVRVIYDPAHVSISGLVAAVGRAGYDVPTTSLSLSIPDANYTWCAGPIERVLAHVMGVTKATAKPQQREVKVVYVPALTSAVQLVAAVRAAGFAAQPKIDDRTCVADRLRRLRFW
jgi:P-type Cu+ transporter